MLGISLVAQPASTQAALQTNYDHVLERARDIVLPQTSNHLYQWDIRGSSYILIWEFSKTLGNYTGMLSTPATGRYEGPLVYIRYHVKHQTKIYRRRYQSVGTGYAFIQVSRVKRTGSAGDRTLKWSNTGKVLNVGLFRKLWGILDHSTLLPKPIGSLELIRSPYCRFDDVALGRTYKAARRS